EAKSHEMRAKVVAMRESARARMNERRLAFRSGTGAELEARSVANAAPLTPALSPESNPTTSAASRGGEGERRVAVQIAQQPATANPGIRPEAVADPNAQPADDVSKPKAEFIAPLTVPQFRVTIAIAREAAKRKLPNLSRRAVREALRGG